MFEHIFKRIDDILRKEAGCTTELGYTEQASWLLFLKYLAELEEERAVEAELDGRKYSYIPDSPIVGKSGPPPRVKTANPTTTPPATNRHPSCALNIAIPLPMPSPISGNRKRSGKFSPGSRDVFTKKPRGAAA
ncbi:MAG TPA: hypothetical protein VN924_10320 [Bryobacteraceae bacterium]|jgi:hypothetical protein|nr:hypothetical protein [Bryobacteraceae bacterium]